MRPFEMKSEQLQSRHRKCITLHKIINLQQIEPWDTYNLEMTFFAVNKFVNYKNHFLCFKKIFSDIS